MIDYSFIISYRDRESHLSKLLPRLYELMRDKSYEIIIAEQDDGMKFQKNSLYNLAALRANGSTLIFHDVDYYPAEGVSYETSELQPMYPVKQLVFLDEDDALRNEHDIPAGYRQFHIDVGNHSGGVFVLSKKLFHKIKGFNPYFKGWGREDDATRDKLIMLGYDWKRNDSGMFYALYHTDNKPSDTDLDFLNNTRLHMELRNNLNVGYDHVTADVDEFRLNETTRWLKIKNFRYANIS